MLTADFDYHLPDELIAQQAVEPRDAARLFAATADSHAHRRIYDLPQLLNPGDLLVMNRTRVIPARFHGQKSTGGQVEVLLIHPVTDHDQRPTWRCMIRGKVGVGSSIDLHGHGCSVVACHDDGQRDLAFPSGCSVIALCDAHGHIPLPPYIRRRDTDHDRQRYQTVFGDSPGSVAAPTAGLHFTTDLLAALDRRDIQRATVDLAVGPGTFKPVQSERVEDHPIHAEHCQCSAETVAAVAACKARGGRVIAVGTTVVRTLESAARQVGGLGPYADWTSLFLYPPQQPLVVDGLLTNFHLPRSSLLMLVACFTGLDRLHACYREIIAARYRFYSYGDAMLWLPPSAQEP